MDNEKQQKEGTQGTSDNEPSTYSKPEVKALGKLEDLTQLSGTKGADGFSGSTAL